MQIPKFAPQERVDLPDLTAVSYLVLGEFRRTVRGLLIGPNLGSPPDHLNYVVRGFAVEAASPPDATVIVRLDPGGANPLSFAIGGENLGARVDAGQLIGGDGMDGTLEGNATYILDFSGQPAGTYTVEMRHVYTDGANDNRAFWDDGANSEFIAATDTRTLPAIELRLSGAPSSEWITLASVVWGGATIVSGNITDARAFALEGTTPFYQTSQTGSGGMADFDRSASRGSAAVGLNEVYPALRALARQIQDLKGANDSGRWDWYSRVFSAHDPADALGAATKSLRSIDTITYSVGDGVSTFGDFNGSAGLDSCLAHIAGLSAANRAEKITIVVHGGIAGNGYLISGARTLSGGTGEPLHVTIRAGTTHSLLNPGAYGRPRITIDGATLTAGQYGVSVSSTSSARLTLEGLEVLWTGTTSSVGMFSSSGAVEVIGCTIEHGTPAVDAGFAIRAANARSSRVVHSTVKGRIQLYDDDATGSRPTEREMGLIEHCQLTSCQIVLRAASAGVPGIDSVNGFAIRHCTITGRGTAVYTGSVALIDARCARRLRIEHCYVSHGTEENAIDGRTYNGASPFDWIIEGCQFDDAAANGTHAVDGGTGTTDGTGWSVCVDSGSHIRLRDCRFALSTSLDAGGVRLDNVEHYLIDSPAFVGCGNAAGGGSGRFDGILLTGGTVFGEIRNVQGTAWAAGVTRVRAVNLDDCSRLTIKGGTLLGQEASFGAVIAPASGYGALRIDEVQDVRIEGVLFESWASNSANSRTIFLDGAGTQTGIWMRGTIFRDCGGYAFQSAGTPVGVEIDDCTHSTTTATAGNFADLVAAIRIRVTNCTGLLTAGGPNIFVRFSTANHLIMGNVCPSGNIDANGSGAAGRGFNEAGQDLNLVNAYVP